VLGKEAQLIKINQNVPHFFSGGPINNEMFTFLGGMERETC